MTLLLDGLRGRLDQIDPLPGLQTIVEDIVQRMRLAGLQRVSDLDAAGKQPLRMCCVAYAEDTVDPFAEEGWRVTETFTVENGTLCAIMEITP